MRNRNLKIAKYAYLERGTDHSEKFQLIMKSRRANNLKFKVAFIAHIVFFAILFLVSIAVYKAYFKEINVLFEGLCTKLMIENVTVMDGVIISDEEIKNFLGHDFARCLTLPDVEKLRAVLLENPIVKNADVKFTLPNQLSIKITEYKPYAAWFYEGRFALIDENGHVIRQNIDFLELEGKYIIAAGKGANERLNLLFNELSSHRIADNLLAVELISGRRWDLLTKDYVLIKLPEMDMKKALKSFDIIMENYKTDKKLTMVDLRLAPQKVYCKFQ